MDEFLYCIFSVFWLCSSHAALMRRKIIDVFVFVVHRHALNTNIALYADAVCLQNCQHTAYSTHSLFSLQYYQEHFRFSFHFSHIIPFIFPFFVDFCVIITDISEFCCRRRSSRSILFFFGFSFGESVLQFSFNK